MPINFYIRKKGREILRVNIAAVCAFIAVVAIVLISIALLSGCQSHLMSQRDYSIAEGVADALAHGANSGRGLTPPECADAANDLGGALDASPTIGEIGQHAVQAAGGIIPAPWGELLALAGGLAYAGFKAKSVYIDRPRKQREAIEYVKGNPAYGRTGEIDLKDPQTQTAVSAAMGHKAWADFAKKNPHLV